MQIRFDITTCDGYEPVVGRHLYIQSPDIPGLYVGGPDLESALAMAGKAAERLIRANNVEALRPLLREGAER